MCPEERADLPKYLSGPNPVSLCRARTLVDRRLAYEGLLNARVQVPKEGVFLPKSSCGRFRAQRPSKIHSSGSRAPKAHDKGKT